MPVYEEMAFRRIARADRLAFDGLLCQDTLEGGNPERMRRLLLRVADQLAERIAEIPTQPDSGERGGRDFRTDLNDAIEQLKKQASVDLEPVEDCGPDTESVWVYRTAALAAPWVIMVDILLGQLEPRTDD